jgi:hypothetical protein
MKLMVLNNATKQAQLKAEAQQSSGGGGGGAEGAAEAAKAEAVQAGAEVRKRFEFVVLLRFTQFSILVINCLLLQARCYMVFSLLF